MQCIKADSQAYTETGISAGLHGTSSLPLSQAASPLNWSVRLVCDLKTMNEVLALKF